MESGDQIASKDSLRKQQIDFMSEINEGLGSHGAASTGSGSQR